MAALLSALRSEYDKQFRVEHQAAMATKRARLHAPDGSGAQAEAARVMKDTEGDSTSGQHEQPATDTAMPEAETVDDECEAVLWQQFMAGCGHTDSTIVRAQQPHYLPDRPVDAVSQGSQPCGALAPEVVVDGRGPQAVLQAGTEAPEPQGSDAAEAHDPHAAVESDAEAPEPSERDAEEAEAPGQMVPPPPPNGKWTHELYKAALVRPKMPYCNRRWRHARGKPGGCKHRRRPGYCQAPAEPADKRGRRAGSGAAGRTV